MTSATAELVIDTEAKVTKFETVICSRCGGSGEYSYCQMYGKTCFKCHGKRGVLTKRGAAAKAYYESLLSVPGSELKVGTVIQVKAFLRTPGFYAIERIGSRIQEGSSMVDGVMTPYRCEMVEIETAIVCQSYLADTFPTQTFRVQCDEETKRAAFAKALEYQATLTKEGTPRKRSAK